MAKKSPSYPWYARDFLADRHVVAMSLEAEACYRRLLDDEWLNGPLPTDVKDLAAICKNVSPRKMAKLWKSIAPCFVPCEGGRGLVNRRLERVRSDMEDLRQKKAAAGRRSGEARANKPGTDVEQNGNTLRAKDEPATATATATASASALRSKTAANGSDETTEPRIALVVAANAAIADRYGEQPVPISHNVAGAHAFTERIAAKGVPVDFAAEIIRERVASRADPRPPRSMSYFTDAVVEAWERKHAPPSTFLQALEREANGS